MRKLLSIVTAIAVITTSLFGGTVYAAGETVTITPKTGVDISLSMGEWSSTINILDFEADLRQALEDKGIPADEINITAYEPENVSADSGDSGSESGEGGSSGWKIYDHTNYENLSNQAIGMYYHYESFGNKTEGDAVIAGTMTPDQQTGQYYLPKHIYVNGSQIDMYGNGSRPYKEFMYMENSDPSVKKLDFVIEEGEFYDALEGGGFLFNTNITGTYPDEIMSGYMLLFRYNNSSLPVYAELYKFTNIDVENFHHNSPSNYIKSFSGVTTLKSVEITDSDNIRVISIEASPTSVRMWYDGELFDWGTNETEISLDTDFGGYGFGPIIGYLSHGCPRHTHFTFKNVTMSKTEPKEFKAVTREPSFASSSTKYVINIDDDGVDELSDPKISAEILSRFESSKTHYIGYGDGNASDKIEADDFIAKNGSRGIYVEEDTTDSTPNNSIDDSIDRVADYIYNQYVTSQDNTPVDYLVQGDTYDIDLNPTGSTIDGSWTEGKWKIIHDNTEFANDLGKADFDNKYLDTLDVNFYNPGKYEITFEDNPVKTIYVHRRPISSYDVTMDGSYNLTFVDSSFDPDADASHPTKGIVDSEWKWKEVGTAVWTDGQLSSLSPNKDYLISYKVQDVQGEWSYPNIKHISTESDATALENLKPISDFIAYPDELKKDVSDSDSIQITDNSYDPACRSIVDEEWKIEKDSVGNVVYTGSTPKTDFRNFLNARYKISHRVKVIQGGTDIWSEWSSRYVTVSGDDRLTILPTTPDAPTPLNGPEAGEQLSSGTTTKVFWGTVEDDDGFLITYQLELDTGSGFSPVYNGPDTSVDIELPDVETNNAKFRVKAICAGALPSSYTTGNAFSIIQNRPPTTPGAITSPSSGDVLKAGYSYLVEWGASTDPDNDSLEYIIEIGSDDNYDVLKQVSGTSTNITMPAETTTSKTIRIKAIDPKGAMSDYVVSDTFSIIQNEPPSTPGPITSPSSGDIVKAGYSYLVEWGASTDPDNDSLEYIIEIGSEGNYDVLKQVSETSTYVTMPAESTTSKTIRIRAIDPKGAMSDYVVSDNFEIDFSDPAVVFTTGNGPYTPNTWTVRKVNFVFVGDPDIFDFKYKLNGSDWTPETTGTIKKGGINELEYQFTDIHSSKVTSSKVLVKIYIPIPTPEPEPDENPIIIEKVPGNDEGNGNNGNEDDGKTVAKIDKDKVEDIKEEDTGDTDIIYTVDVPEEDETVILELTQEVIDEIQKNAYNDGNNEDESSGEEKDVLIDLKTPFGEMELPVKELDEDENDLSDSTGLGKEETKKAKINVTIKKATEKESEDIKKDIETKDITIVGPIIKYDVTVETEDGEQTPINKFDKYTDRKMYFNKEDLGLPTSDNLEKDIEKLIVVMIDEKTGETIPVPAKIYVDKDGQVTVDIKHNGTGSYTIIKSDNKITIDNYHWASETIEKVSQKYMLYNVLSDSIDPEIGTTRAELASIMLKVLGINSNQSDIINEFNDLNTDHKLYKEVLLADQLGILIGYGNGNTKPDKIISRQEMAAVVHRTINKMKSVSDNPDGIKDYTDESFIHEYAVGKVGALTELQILEGRLNNEFSPTDSVTLAEALTVLERLSEYLLD